MTVSINGNQEEIPKDLTIQQLLSFKKVQAPDMVSVELNGTILKRTEFATARVADGDAIEFLYFMGGGRG